MPDPNRRSLLLARFVRHQLALARPRFARCARPALQSSAAVAPGTGCTRPILGGPVPVDRSRARQRDQPVRPLLLGLEPAVPDSAPAASSGRAWPRPPPLRVRYSTGDPSCSSARRS